MVNLVVAEQSARDGLVFVYLGAAVYVWPIHLHHLMSENSDPLPIIADLWPIAPPET